MKGLQIAVAAVVLMIVAALAYTGYNQLQDIERQPYADYKYQPARDRFGLAMPKNPRVAAKPYQPYCNNPKDRDDADLCAQWASVQVVGESNRLGRTGIIVTGLELLALVVSIFFTAWAALAAAKASAAASKTVDYFAAVERPRLVVRPKSVSFEGGDAWEFTLQLDAENVGRSAAYTTFLYWRAMDHNDYIPKLGYQMISSEDVIPEEGRNLLSQIKISKEDFKPYIWGRLDYHSPFGDHETYFCISVETGNAKPDIYGGGTGHGPQAKADKGISWPHDT